MAIDLTGLSFAAMEPSLLEFGGIQRGSLGGPSQNLQRIGNRFSFALALPPLPALTGWTGELVAAKQEGAIIRIPEPGFPAGGAFSASVAGATAGGLTVPLAGLTPGYAVPGKWVSFIHGGRRYAHLVRRSTVAARDGSASITITPMLRTPLSVGDLVEIGEPKAEGLLSDRLAWSIGKSRLVAFTLTLEEQR